MKNACPRPRRGLFQSTHSLRSATGDELDVMNADLVSIHALLAECDFAICLQIVGANGFNPRTPCGVRRKPTVLKTFFRKFQSTHSLRSATVRACHASSPLPVSIHALLAECDFTVPIMEHQQKSFNPRTPCGVRQSLLSGRLAHYQFQSTHSLRSATANM